MRHQLARRRYRGDGLAGAFSAPRVLPPRLGRSIFNLFVISMHSFRTLLFSGDAATFPEILKPMLI